MLNVKYWYFFVVIDLFALVFIVLSDMVSTGCPRNNNTNWLSFLDIEAPC